MILIEDRKSKIKDLVCSDILCCVGKMDNKQTIKQTA